MCSCCVRLYLCCLYCGCVCMCVRCTCGMLNKATRRSKHQQHVCVSRTFAPLVSVASSSLSPKDVSSVCVYTWRTTFSGLSVISVGAPQRSSGPIQASGFSPYSPSLCVVNTPINRVYTDARCDANGAIFSTTVLVVVLSVMDTVVARRDPNTPSLHAKIAGCVSCGMSMGVCVCCTMSPSVCDGGGHA